MKNLTDTLFSLCSNDTSSLGYCCTNGPLAATAINPEYRFWQTSYETATSPKYKIENNNAIFEIVVPGYEKEEISISVEDRKLVVRADNSKRGNSIFAYEIPVGFAPDKGTAALSNGILTVSFPRDKTKEIKIKIG